MCTSVARALSGRACDGDDLLALSRKELQARAKAANIKANQKSDAIRDALRGLNGCAAATESPATKDAKHAKETKDATPCVNADSQAEDRRLVKYRLSRFIRGEDVEEEHDRPANLMSIAYDLDRVGYVCDEWPDEDDEDEALKMLQQANDKHIERLDDETASDVMALARLLKRGVLHMMDKESMVIFQASGLCFTMDGKLVVFNER